MALEHPSLLVASLVAFVAGFAYLFVAAEFRRRIRQAQQASRKPLLFFALWWACLGVNIVLGGLLYFAASIGYTDFALQLVYAVMQRLLLSVSLVGLMYYLLFLLTERDWLLPLSAFYCAYFLFIIYIMQSGAPDGVYVGKWRSDLDYTQSAPPLLGLLNFAMLVVPPVVAAIAYFIRVFPRAEDRQVRYRVALVSWSLIGWWLMAVIAGQREAYGNEEFQLVNRFAGLVAALLILAAYRPPAPVRRWLEQGQGLP